MEQLTPILSLVGNTSIAVVMIILAKLSQRLGHVTLARHYYLGLYLASVLVLSGVIVHAFLLGQGIDGGLELQQEVVWVLLIKGLPALGITIALLVVWYYWSWLLAERN